MGGPKKQSRGSGRPKLQKGDKPQAKANKHLAGQIRKILGKHSAGFNEKKRTQGRNPMRILFSSMVAATLLVTASAVGWKAEAATVTGVGTLPPQTKSYTPVETVAYRHYRRAYRRGYRRGYYGYGYGYRPYGYYGYGYRPYGYYGYGWRPGISIYVGPRWGWGWGY